MCICWKIFTPILDCEKSTEYNRVSDQTWAKNRLYVDDVEVLNGATSFHLHSDFLLVTTIQHQLKSLPLSAVFSDNVTKEELWATESVRALERGSRIVASDAQGTKVILQVSYLDIKLRNCSILTRSFVNHI